jgi:hypothetical protein
MITSGAMKRRVRSPSIVPQPHGKRTNVGMIYYWLDRTLAELPSAARRDVLGDLLAYVVELTERTDAQG